MSEEGKEIKIQSITSIPENPTQLQKTKSPLAKIRQLRDTNTMDLPNGRVNSTSKENATWARKGNWAALEVWLSLALKKGEITNPEQLNEVTGFLDYCHTVIPKRNMLIPEDIDKLKQLMNSLFGEELKEKSV